MVISAHNRRQPNQDKINAEVFAIQKEFFGEALSKDDAKDIIEMEKEFFEDGKEDNFAELQADLERLKKQYAQKEKAKNKVFEKMQNLDSSDLNYDMKFDDLQNLQDKLYSEMRKLDKQINELEASLNETQEERESYEESLKFYSELTADYFGDLSDEDKKALLNILIERVDIFEDDKEHGRWVKHIRFKIPISYKDNEEVLDYYPDDNWCDTVNHDETVVLMSRLE